MTVFRDTTMKDTYDFDSKAKAREKLRGFVETVVSKRSRRKDLKVLTMSGHEDVEFKQIWDPLGIPRENITVVEANPKAYELIRKQNLGVNLVDAPMSMTPFLRSTQQTFDVMNLDYMGVFDLDKRGDLGVIASRGLLGEKGVLATWYSGKREHGDAKKAFNMIQSINKNHRADMRDWKESRGDIIFESIEHIFLQGCGNAASVLLLKNPLIFKNCIEQYKKMISDFNEQYALTRITEDSWRDCIQISLPFVIANILDKSRDRLPIEFNGISPYALTSAICAIEFQSYISTIHNSYRYISDAATPMLVDINYFKKEEFEKFITYGMDGDQLMVRLRSHDKDDVKKFKNAINAYPGWHCNDKICPSRVFLGSSATGKRVGKQSEQIQQESPLEIVANEFDMISTQEQSQELLQEMPAQTTDVSYKDAITKEDAIGLLQAGYAPKEIAECYHGFSKGQLAAFKAHLTMKTYQNGTYSYRKSNPAA